MRNICIQRLVGTCIVHLGVFEVQTCIRLIGKNEGVALFEWIDSQCIRSCWAEVSHFESLLDAMQAFAGISLREFFGCCRVQQHIRDILAAGAKEVDAVNLKLMWVCNQINCFYLFVLQLGEQARIEWLLGHKRIAKVSFSRH